MANSGSSAMPAPEVGSRGSAVPTFTRAPTLRPTRPRPRADCRAMAQICHITLVNIFHTIQCTLL